MSSRRLRAGIRRARSRPGDRVLGVAVSPHHRPRQLGLGCRPASGRRHRQRLAEPRSQRVHHLQGCRYESIDTQVRLDTDAAGLLTLTPLSPPPLVMGRDRATSGRGRAVDLGVAAVVEGWELGFSINGIGNYINWRDVRRDARFMGNLFLGQGQFVDSPDVVLGDVRVELPWTTASAAALSTGSASSTCAAAATTGASSGSRRRASGSTWVAACARPGGVRHRCQRRAQAPGGDCRLAPHQPAVTTPITGW